MIKFVTSLLISVSILTASSELTEIPSSMSSSSAAASAAVAATGFVDELSGEVRFALQYLISHRQISIPDLHRLCLSSKSLYSQFFPNVLESYEALSHVLWKQTEELTPKDRQTLRLFELRDSGIDNYFRRNVFLLNTLTKGCYINPHIARKVEARLIAPHFDRVSTGVTENNALRALHDSILMNRVCEYALSLLNELSDRRPAAYVEVLEETLDRVAYKSFSYHTHLDFKDLFYVVDFFRTHRNQPQKGLSYLEKAVKIASKHGDPLVLSKLAYQIKDLIFQTRLFAHRLPTDAGEDCIKQAVLKIKAMLAGYLRQNPGSTFLITLSKNLSGLYEFEVVDEIIAHMKVRMPSVDDIQYRKRLGIICFHYTRTPEHKEFGCSLLSSLIPLLSKEDLFEIRDIFRDEKRQNDERQAYFIIMNISPKDSPLAPYYKQTLDSLDSIEEYLAGPEQRSHSAASAAAQ